MSNKKIYFASDQHFGAPTPEASFPREQKFVAWLDEVKKDAEAIFLLGDLFDFWFEYQTVVPKGFVRVLGKLAEIRDSGIPIYFFVGNHDLWMNDYFEKELNIPVYHDNKEFTFNEKTFLIGHGDGKNPATENEACPGRHSIGRWTPGLALYARAIFARAWQTQSHSTLMVACIG